jgi:hypothetical protein
LRKRSFYFLLDEQCRYVFDERQFSTGWLYYVSQLHGLSIKTLLVRYRRWGLTLIVLLLPIIYNLLSNIISRSQSTNDTFKMQTNLLNPQTILYNADPSMERYFQAAVGSSSSGTVLEKRSENILDMNKYVLRKFFIKKFKPLINYFLIEKRKDRPYTYTDIYLGFQILKPQGDKYKIQTLSSNLISGYEVFSVASDTFFKYALDDTSASIQTTLVYKRTGNFTIQPTIGGLLNLLSIASCYLKFIPTSLLLDV